MNMELLTLFVTLSLLTIVSFIFASLVTEVDCPSFWRWIWFGPVFCTELGPFYVSRIGYSLLTPINSPNPGGAWITD